MTDVSYKILMSLIGREIEKHVAENEIEKFEQTGFTKGGNILDNPIAVYPKRMHMPQ